MTSESDLIGNGGIAATRTLSPAEVRKMSAMVLGFIAIGTVTCLWAFGRPYSNWLYVVLGLGLLPAIDSLVTGKPQSLPRTQPLAKQAALRHAVLHGVASGIWAYTFVITLTGAFHQWPPAIILSVIAGVQSYDAARLNKRSWTKFTIICAVLLVILTAFVVWKTSAR